MSGHDSKYFSTTKKGEIPELKEELNSQYKVPPTFTPSPSLPRSCSVTCYACGLWFLLVDPDLGAALGFQPRPLLDLRVSVGFFVGFGRVGGWDFAPQVHISMLCCDE
jgi:hypothetical protein